MSELGYQIKCPYCGHEEPDSWEMLDEDGTLEELECGDCEKTYFGKLSVSVDYWTYTTEEYKNKEAI